MGRSLTETINFGPVPPELFALIRPRIMAAKIGMLLDHEAMMNPPVRGQITPRVIMAVLG